MNQRLNYKTIFFSVWMVSLLSLPVFAQYELDCHVENEAFGHQEELTYKIYYNLDFLWIPAGEVHFTIKTNKDHHIVEARGQTYSSYEWFYKVDDYYRTVIDKETMLPITAERTVREGGYRLYEFNVFDHDRGRVHVTRGRDKESATDRGFVQFDGCTADLVTLFFRLRNVDKDAFIDAGSMPINFFLDMEQYQIPMRYIKSERKRIRGLGKYETIHVSPRVLSGHVFKDGTELSAWVSDDNNRIPLLIESPLSVGTAKAVLKSHKEIRYPLGGNS